MRGLLLRISYIKKDGQTLYNVFCEQNEESGKNEKTGSPGVNLKRESD